MNELKAGEPFRPCVLRDGAFVPDAILNNPSLSAGARLLWGILAAYQGKSVACSPLEATLR